MATHTSRLFTLSAFVALGAGCNMAPRYTRPTADVPSEYRGARADTARAESLGEAKWSEVFRDAELQKLIRKAVEENNDVHIAAARVLQARAQLTITRSDQLPTATVEATATNERTPTTTRGGVTLPSSTDNVYGVDGTLFWELDFWGKFRNATEAEKATLLGTQWAARAVLVTVVSSVAQSYFTL